MHSCIYRGEVVHRRFTDVDHDFRYRLFLMYLDLDELPGLFDRHWLWSARRPSLAWFRRADYLGPADQTLSESVREYVTASTGLTPSGPIRLLTHLRYFGYVINPVSFYFCFDRDDTNVESIVAEVTNTPWGERHCYVIPPSAWQRETNSGQRVARAQHAKEFHVSPYLPMEMNYRWRIEEPGESLSISVENLVESHPVFQAALTLQRRPLTAANLARVLARHPLMTAQVATAIYWQAVRLWWKGTTFYPHPGQLRPAGGQPVSASSLPNTKHQPPAESASKEPTIL